MCAGPYASGAPDPEALSAECKSSLGIPFQSNPSPPPPLSHSESEFCAACSGEAAGTVGISDDCFAALLAKGDAGATRYHCVDMLLKGVRAVEAAGRRALTAACS